MKKTKSLMLFLLILLIFSLFAGCIPTIPTNSTNLEGEGKGGLNVEADVDPKSGTPPHQVQCVGFVSGGLMPYTYQWEFGDGSWSEKGMEIEHRDVFHTYLNSGKYKPILHVEDSRGKKGECKAGTVIVEKKIPFNDGDEFAGEQWIIDTDGSPGSNQYSDSIENIWLDELGQLHFKMTRDKDTKRWKCVEIYSEQEGNWGYGKYEFEIEVVSDGKIDENVVIGLFTYDDEASEEYNREIDFEYSKWGIPIISNSQFVIQNGPDSIERFNIPLENYKAKISFDWQKEEIIFYYQCGDKENEIILPKNGEICKPPIPGNERVYMNLWLYHGKPYNEDKMEKVELVIKDFKFTPTLCGPVHNLTKDTYYDTIQAALNGADSNNTIEVSDGTYDESITFPSGKLITLKSINGNSSTIIRGNDGSNTVTLNNSPEGTTLKGFTITHENGNSGRGIYIYSGGYLNINYCTISGNTADDSGGGICNYGTLTITGTTISSNSAGYGGGIYNNGTLTIIGTTISGNTANYAGGGIYNIFYSGTLTITGSTVSGNLAGGGIYYGYGGGIYNGQYSTLTITETTISSNSAGYGGGIFNYYSTLTIIDSTVSDTGNSAYDGGGIYNWGGTLTIIDSTVSGNSAYYGGGIYNSYSGTLTITGSTVSGNSAYYHGGGIYIGLTSGTSTIGGSSNTDTGNFNEFVNNYKTGNSPC